MLVPIGAEDAAKEWTANAVSGMMIIPLGTLGVDRWAARIAPAADGSTRKVVSGEATALAVVACVARRSRYAHDRAVLRRRAALTK